MQTSNTFSYSVNFLNSKNENDHRLITESELKVDLYNLLKEFDCKKIIAVDPIVPGNGDVIYSNLQQAKNLVETLIEKFNQSEKKIIFNYDYEEELEFIKYIEDSINCTKNEFLKHQDFNFIKGSCC